MRDRSLLEAGWTPGAAVTARVHRITGTVEDMVSRLDRFGVGDRQAYTVVATATTTTAPRAAIASG